MSEVENTPVNPEIPDLAPVEEVDVNASVEEADANPLLDWVESQKNMQETALAEKDQELEAKEKAKIEANSDLVDASDEEIQEDPNLSARFNALSKREKLLVERERELKQREERLKYFDENYEQLKRSPKKVLEELGLDFEKFTSAYLDELDGKKPEKSVEDMIAEVQKEQSEWRSQFEDQQRQMQEAQKKQFIENYKKDLKNYLSSEPNLEKYELINAKGAYDTVYDVIQSYFMQTQEETGQGQTISVDEAAQLVEEHFEEEAKTFLKAKKFAEKKEEEPKPEKHKKSVTLSNKSSGGAVQVNHADDLSKLSKTEESKRKAAQKLKWT